MGNRGERDKGSFPRNFLQDPGVWANVKLRLPVAFCLQQHVNIEAAELLKKNVKFIYFERERERERERA